MPMNQADLLAKLEANAKRQKEVNQIASEQAAILRESEPTGARESTLATQERPLPVGNQQR